MRTDLTDVTVILDRSGSMGYIKQATIDGFNEFIDGQRKDAGETRISLVQFDTDLSSPYVNVDVNNEAVKLTHLNYIMGGATALFDAICTTVDRVGQRLAATPLAERPNKVVVVILTDGQENASRLYKLADVEERIKHQREKYQWDFVFLGANQDAIATAAQLGIAAGAALTFAANDLGATRAYASVSNYVSLTKMRGIGEDVSFSDADRNAQTQAGA